MTKTQYRVRIKLTPLPEHLHPILIDTLFDGAVKQLDDYKDARRSKSMLDAIGLAVDAATNAHLASLEVNRLHLKLAKHTATVVTTATGAELAFDLPYHAALSEEDEARYHSVSEEGMRRWVRQEFEDLFLNRMQLKRLRYYSETTEPIYAALSNAFADANRLDAPLFSIDGEKPSGLERDAAWTRLLDETSVPVAIEKLRSFMAENPNVQPRIPGMRYDIMTFRGMASVPSGAAREVVLQEMKDLLEPLAYLFNIVPPAGFSRVSDMVTPEEMIWTDDGLGKNEVRLILPSGEAVVIDRSPG